MITLQEIHERDKRPPSVTVNMTCYNHEKYLDEAIRGVLMQKTNFPVNIVIHDDASTDRSQEIIRRYASENPNITVILEESNYYQNGMSFFPKVLPYLTGKYVAYCECDDFWIDEHKLQIQVDYLENNPDCVAVYSNTLPVNKHSQYDETTRTHYMKTKEGDYPSTKIIGIEHQLASLVLLNFWQFMPQEELSFYINIKANGDQKIFSICLRLGRVHYFREEFAAHRRVFDEGDSYTARMAKKTNYELLKHNTQNISELYRMVEHFFKKRYYKKYFQILWADLSGIVKYHNSVIKDIPLHKVYQYRNVPLFIWPAFILCVPYMAMKATVKKFAKIILPKKVLTSMKRFKYNWLMAHGSWLMAHGSCYDYVLVSSNRIFRISFSKVHSRSSSFVIENFFVHEYLTEVAA